LNTNRILYRNTLQATERLQLKKQIETLFQTGKAFSVMPIRVVFSFVPRAPDEISPVRAGFVIPKKRVRKAVARNRKRRLLKEAWRLHKQSLYAAIPEGAQLHCFLIYNGKEKFTFAEASEAVGKIIPELIRKAGRL
jgi:ribonuclease P protein component